MKYLDMRRLSFLAANPDLLEQMIEANLVVRRNIAGAAVGGVDERAGQRIPRAVQRRVKLQVAVRNFDAAARPGGNVPGMLKPAPQAAALEPLSANVSI